MRLLLITLFCLHLLGAAQEQLYLLQASPNRPYTTTRVWSFGPDSALIPHRKLISEEKAIESIHYDQDAHLISFAFSDPLSIIVFRMGDPDSVRKFPIENKQQFKGRAIVPLDGVYAVPNLGLFQAFLTFDEQVFTGEFAINLNARTPVSEVLEKNAIRFYRKGGAVVFDFDEAVVPQMSFGESGPVYRGETEPPFAFPKDFSNGVVKPTTAYIHAATQELFVVTRSNDYRKEDGANGSLRLWTRMDATGEWRTIQVPGSFPAVRVLDNRVAITLRTAWNQRPRFVRGKFMLSDLQRRYEESEYEYPGTLLVYDPAAGQTWELQTGHSDSEILLIRGDELYYRIHTKLIRARLSPGGTVKTEQVLADRPEIAEMHWAFFGPATSQPVEGVKARVQKPAPSPKVPRVVNEMPPGIYFEYYTGDLPEPSIKSLHPLIIQNGWQVWFLRNQRMPELTDYLIGPFADEDEIDLVKEKFKEGNLNLRRRKFPEAVPLP